MKRTELEREAYRIHQLARGVKSDAMDQDARRKALDKNMSALKAAEAEYSRAATALLERSDAATLKAFCIARAEKKRLQDERRRLWA